MRVHEKVVGDLAAVGVGDVNEQLWLGVSLGAGGHTANRTITSNDRTDDEIHRFLNAAGVEACLVGRER
jgi:hypothetical protein